MTLATVKSTMAVDLTNLKRNTSQIENKKYFKKQC